MSLLALDTLDDRREVWHLLHRLSPAARVRFVASRCRLVRDRRGGVGPTVARLTTGPTLAAAGRCDRADHALTTLLYADLLQLAATWGLDLGAAAAELERTARLAG